MPPSPLSVEFLAPTLIESLPPPPVIFAKLFLVALTVTAVSPSTLSVCAEPAKLVPAITTPPVSGLTVIALPDTVIIAK